MSRFGMLTPAKAFVSPKLDFKQWTKPVEPEPKTLEECLQEAGGFPFVARAVAPSTKLYQLVLPVGTEARMDRRGKVYPDFFISEELGSRVDATNRRWTLVGHRT